MDFQKSDATYILGAMTVYLAKREHHAAKAILDKVAVGLSNVAGREKVDQLAAMLSALTGGNPSLGVNITACQDLVDKIFAEITGHEMQPLTRSLLQRP